VTGASESNSILYRVAILIILVTKINKLTTKRQRKFVRSTLIYISISLRWALWALALGAAPLAPTLHNVGLRDLLVAKFLTWRAP
jgi:hypothetical protein